MVVASGEFVASYLEGVEKHQIQPNGVDLTVGKIYRARGEAIFSSTGYDKPARMEIHPNNGAYRFPPGQYIIVYDETIEIPEDHIGRVYPRSRLMRSGLHLTSALWDAGYRGKGEGLLRVPRSVHPVEIEEELPIAQMVFQKADDAESYNGSHQGERL